jgi:hypothetical protein
MARVPVAGRYAPRRVRPLRDGSLTQRLLGAYSLEADLYQSLLAAAQEQGELLEDAAGSDGDGLDPLAALFAQKDQLLDRIARIEEKAAPLKDAWRHERVPPPHRQRLNDLLDGILTTMDSIVEQEQRNEVLLAQRDDGRRGRTPHAPSFLPSTLDPRPEQAADTFPLTAVS